MIENQRFRERLAAVEVELKALEMTQLRVVAAEAKRGDKGKPDPASSILKIKGSELQQATTELLMEVVRAVCPAVPAGSHGRLERAAHRHGLGRDRRADLFQTGARSRSTADPTRSRRTLSLRQSWVCEGGCEMDFDLNDEQRLIKDSVERLLADRYDFEQRKKHGASDKAGARICGRNMRSSACSPCLSPWTTAEWTRDRSAP